MSDLKRIEEKVRGDYCLKDFCVSLGDDVVKLARALNGIHLAVSNAVIESIRAEFDGPLRAIKMDRKQYVQLATNASHAGMDAVQAEAKRVLREVAGGEE